MISKMCFLLCGFLMIPTSTIFAEDLRPRPSDIVDGHRGRPKVEKRNPNGLVIVIKEKEKSKNLYAIPYKPGVKVRANRDHITHTPQNRIDMSGRSGGPYEIVAALSGTVEYIQDSFDINGECRYNNYVWLSHANNEWSKYSHLAQNSASHLTVGEKISVGDKIGIESDIGCASGDHLHWEIAIPDDINNPIKTSGGYIKGKNVVPRICGIPNNEYVAGTTYTVPKVRPGWSEYARHGLPDSLFQKDFEAAAACGYRMDWNSGYDRSKNKATFNVIYHPNKAPTVGWKSHRRLTTGQLSQKKNSYGNQGYKLVHIDIYKVGTKIRYAAIFKKSNKIAKTKTYHGKTPQQHQQLFNNYKTLGWKPRVISVTSDKNGKLLYAAVYSKKSIGSWMAKSVQTASQYQQNFNSNKQNGRKLIYVKTYMYKKKFYYSAIWASKNGASKVFAKHGLTSAAYQGNYNSRRKLGYKTRAVSAAKVGKKTRFAAYWNK